MKLNEFIANVLGDISKGIQEAKSQTNRNYYVDVSTGKGVNFDIAVTTVTTNENQAEGTAKAGFVEVLGAGVSGKLNSKNENSEVSRIQFSVFVPIQTQQEEEADMAAWRARNNEIENKDDNF